ncbi:MAG: hypothetical protein KJ558_10230 [Gammaproteobacteria bacterium]|nr:hypothetical protein [Gammaproteobacteria bacterium]MBU1655184.1 hypothetical protein [Gammaproteobacteria bacterium]MBU1959995.1 hypothetical protein [Gammaproteobacteria bacterium]
MNKTLEAMNAMWAFAAKLTGKHGMEGDGSMTNEEHKEWQEAAGLCHEALHAIEAIEEEA